MRSLRVGSQRFEVGAFVFDKDGLMFESQCFWQELARERRAGLVALEDEAFWHTWADCFGVTLDERGEPCYVDPDGIFALAPESAEIDATATLIVQRRHGCWDDAHAAALDIFRRADAALSLQRALRPRPGFPDILRRLTEAGVPCCVATSDTMERAQRSLTLFAAADYISHWITPVEVAHGKPAPDMLLLAAERLQLPVGALAMVGDSHVDMEMALAAGATGIGVPETDKMRGRMQALGAYIADDLTKIEIL